MQRRIVLLLRHCDIVDKYREKIFSTFVHHSINLFLVGYQTHTYTVNSVQISTPLSANMLKVNKVNMHTT